MQTQLIRRAIVLLLITGLLINTLPGSLAVNTYSLQALETPLESADTAQALTDIEENTNGIGQLDASSVPEIVGYEEACRQNHILRLYDEEDDLNKVIFLNEDGSRTLYLYDHPVKYVDDSGKVRDISLDIASAETGFRTASGSAVTTFSANLADGISLSGNDVNISLVPVLAKTVPQTEKVTANATVQPIQQNQAQRIDSKTIAYPYDSKTTLAYSLTYTGFKEDIVVSEYTGQTEYPFMLYTHGYALTEINGSYYLTDDAGNIKANIGDIIIFTADERNNTFGQIIPTTIVENEQYLLTIVVDADFLADEKTAYPIRIDPTVEINYDSNSSGIQDVTVCDATTYSGSHWSLYIGDKEGVGLCRALMKFPALGFLDSNVTVQSATLKMRDLMCEGEMLDIYCHIFSGNEWSDSGATWTSTNAGSNNSIGTQLDTVSMSYDTGYTLNPRHWYDFDITLAVQSWANGTSNLNKGIIFKASVEIENGDTGMSRSLGAYNRSEDKPSLTVTYTVNTDTDDEEDLTPEFSYETVLQLDGSYQVSTTAAGETVGIKFIPPVTGEYLFYSTMATGDPELLLYNSNITFIDGDDDQGGNGNFRLTAYLTEGEVYYLSAGHYGSNIGSYNINILISADIPNTVYYLRNINSLLYLDIHDLYLQNYANQYSYYAGEQLKWRIIPQTDGTYVIRSEYENTYYLGISSPVVGIRNVELMPGISNSTKWRIYAKSNGELFIESASAPGCVLSILDRFIGDELCLELLSNTQSGNANKWKLAVELPTILEGQKMSNWCWNASARMLVNHYYAVSNARTQETAENWVRGRPPQTEPANMSGTLSNAVTAAEYYYEASDETGRTLGLITYENKRLSQSVIRQFLNNNHVIYIGRASKKDDGTWWNGHASLIVGYTTIYMNGSMEYRYIIYDPWPAELPNPWKNSTVTDGQKLERSYDWLCNGQNQTDGTNDTRIWYRYIVVETSYAGDNLPPKTS